VTIALLKLINASPAAPRAGGTRSLSRTVGIVGVGSPRESFKKSNAASSQVEDARSGNAECDGHEPGGNPRRHAFEHLEHVAASDAMMS
jgi:hypothetical protein